MSFTTRFNSLDQVVFEARAEEHFLQHQNLYSSESNVKNKGETLMQDAELYIDLLVSLAQWTRVQVARLSPEELAWQPYAEGNNIAVTVWHISRWLDVTGRLLQEKPGEEELWLTQGWAERTGYNPQGIGYQGLGVLTGYTPQEVAAVPLLSAQELLTYLDQACEALRVYLRFLPSSEILLQAVGEPRLSLPGQRSAPTKQQVLKTVIMGSCGHVGEIEALKAMMKRAVAEKQPTLRPSHS